MKGIKKLREFAKDLTGKTITDMIEALYFVEVEDESELSVSVPLMKWEPYTKGWVWVDFRMPEEMSRDNAVDYLMRRYMENKWETLAIDVTYVRSIPHLYVYVRLVAKDEKHPKWEQ